MFYIVYICIGDLFKGCLDTLPSAAGKAREYKIRVRNTYSTYIKTFHDFLTWVHNVKLS